MKMCDQEKKNVITRTGKQEPAVSICRLPVGHGRVGSFLIIQAWVKLLGLNQWKPGVLSKVYFDKTTLQILR